MEGLLDGIFEPTEEIFAATAREATRLKRVAADLSTLSRAEESVMELVTAPVDLGAVAAEAAERLRPQFEGSDVALHVRRPGALPVDGDQDRLTQVFTNIIGNALHLHPGRGQRRSAGTAAGFRRGDDHRHRSGDRPRNTSR